VPRAVAQHADHRLDQQPGDRACQIENGQIVRIGADHGEQRIDRGLLQTHAVIDAEESEVHQEDGLRVDQRLSSIIWIDRSISDVFRCDLLLG